MTNFVANTTLGGTGTNEAFITGTRTWAGGQSAYSSAYNNQPFEANTGVIITGRDCIVQANQIKARGAPGASAVPTPSTSFQLAGSHNDTRSPTYTFNNVILDMNEANQGWTRANLNWTNVTWYNTSTRTDTVGLGNWGAISGTGGITFNTVNLWGDVVSNNTTKATSFWFLTPAPNSSFVANNVSFWNGSFATSITDSGNLRSSSAQFGNGTVWNQPTFGPVGQDGGGFAYNDAASLARRIPLRFSAPSTTANIQTIVGSPDCRAWHNLPDSTGLNVNAAGWAIAVDGAAQVWWINPLEGIPTNGLSLTNVTRLNNTAPQVFTSLVGTRLATSASDYILVNNSAVPWYSFPDTIATTNATSVATTLTGNIQTVDTTANSDINDNGFAFQTQTTSRVFTTNTSATTFGNGTRDLDYTVAPSRTFRIYKWQRRELDWGREITIAPPVSGATDAQVTTARTNGYLTHNGASFEGSFNVDTTDTFDEVFSEMGSDYATPTSTRNNVGGGVNEGSAIWAFTKLEAWDEVRASTSTDLIPILGRRDGLIVRFGDTTAQTFATNYDVELSRSESTITPNMARTSITLPARRYDVTDFVNAVEARNITITGDVNQAKDLESSGNPCTLQATGTLTYAMLDNNKALVNEDISATTINLPATFTNAITNLNIATGSLTGNTTINNWNTASTVTGLVAASNAGLIFNLSGTVTGAHSLDSLFGENRNFGGVTTTVTINSTGGAITITTPAGAGDGGPGTSIFVTNDGSTTSGQVTYVAGTNVTFEESGTYDFRVSLENITGNSWALYVGLSGNIETTPRFSSHSGSTITGITSGTGDTTYGSIGTLGGVGGITDLYLVTGNAQNATRTVKLVVSNPMIQSTEPRPADTPLTAISAPQNTGTARGHNGTIHSVSVRQAGDAAIGTGTNQPIAGNAVIELSNLSGLALADEEQTQNVWADARDTLGWKNAIIAQRSTILTANTFTSGSVDTYDLFLPDGFGGLVKNVFLTDLDAGTSRTGIHVLTGTRYAVDDRTAISTAFNVGDRNPDIARNAIPVLEIDNGARQFIFQQSANDPTAVTTSVLDTRGVTRQNLVNIGLNAPIIQADGTGLDTSFSTTDGG